MTIARLAGTESARLVQTTAVKEITRDLAVVLPRHEVLVVYGDPGTGKDTAVDMCLAIQERLVTWLDLPPKPSNKEVVKDFHKHVLGVTDTGPERILQDELVDALARDERIVVVRDADHLPTEATQQLRWLHSRPGARWSMILVGGPRLGKALGRDPLLRGSAAALVKVKPLRDSELVAFLRDFHPIFHGAPADLLITINTQVCHGLIKTWARFLQWALALQALRESDDQNVATLDVTLAKAVISKMAPLARAGRPT